MNVFKKLQNYIAGYSHFENPEIIKAVSLWIAGTYMFESFDSYPYLVITARTKQAGKTRLSELLSFTSNMPFRVAGASAASLFRKIQDDKPTIIWDEAETLSSEASSLVRAFLNVGYRKGQTIPRATGNGVTEYPTYCPKVFVLIGDVYDTLRDRSLIVTMQRGTPKRRFSYENAKAEGEEIATELRETIANNMELIAGLYEKQVLQFLTDRDEEIWRPLFSIAQQIDTESYQPMRVISADMAAEKTNPVKYVPNVDAEKKIQMEQFGARLLCDLLRITSKMKAVQTIDAIPMLMKIDVAPWRKYMGTGLDPIMMADLLAIFDLKPKPQRVGAKVFRGYSRKEIEAAARKAKLDCTKFV